MKVVFHHAFDEPWPARGIGRAGVAGALLQSEPDLEFGNVSHDENHHHKHGDAIGNPCMRPLREARAGAGVCFGEEILPAPAVAARAEQHIHQATQRKHVIRDNEIF